MLQNENNYKSTTSLTLTEVDTKAGEDLTINWPSLTQDLQCHTVDPKTSVKNISLVRCPNQTHAEAQKTLIKGNLNIGSGSDADVDLYREHNTDGSSTTAQLSSMTQIGGSPAIVVAQDYVQRETDSYVIIASSTVTPGNGAMSMIFVNPKAGVENTTVDIPSGCGKLVFDANLHELTKVPVSTTGPWVFDWSQVTMDSESKEAVWQLYDSYDLIIGHYEMPLADIEQDFFDVEANASHMWKIKNLTGDTLSAKLSSAQDANGELFTGFTPTDGTWLLGLQCPNCQNPAPIFLTLLDVGGAH